MSELKMKGKKMGDHLDDMLKKHKKPTKETKGGIVTKEGYIHLSNLKQLDEGKTKTKDKK